MYKLLFQILRTGFKTERHRLPTRIIAPQMRSNCTKKSCATWDAPS